MKKKKYIIAVCLCLISACTAQPIKLVDCSLPQKAKLSTLFASAQHKLALDACHYHFDQYESQLMDKAKSQPGKENFALFKAFYQTAVDHGVLSTIDSKKRLTHHFSPRYTDVIPNLETACSIVNNKDKLFQALDEAQKAKRVGIAEILGDEEAYYKAAQSYEDLVYVFDVAFEYCGS